MEGLGEGSIWSVSEGHGVPVVLCSGGPGCCDYLEPVAQLLQSDLRTVRFDFRGCGRSGHLPAYSVQTSLEDIEAIRNRYGLDSFVLLGHSFGADLAIAYALRFPSHVQGIVCLSGGRVNDDREWHRLYSERRDQGLETLPEFQFRHSPDVNAQVNASWKQFIQRPTLLKEVASIENPTLCLYGTLDIRPSWPVEQVANLMPHARMRLIEGADHYLWRTHGDVVQKEILDFVRAI